MLSESIVDLGPVQFIRGEKNGRYPYCHSVFIPEAGVLIDPASDINTINTLKEDVQAIWLSHWHEDHIMYLSHFSNLPLLMHQADEPPLTDISIYTTWYDLEPGRDDPIIDQWKKILVELFNFEPRSASEYLQDGQLVDLGSVTVEIIHAPGHSPGNLAFYFREPEILFIGDNDLTKFGPWYGDRYSNIDQIIKTVQKLRSIPAKTWITGHEAGIFTEVPKQTWDDYLAVIQRREDKLYDFLNSPKSIEEIGKAWIVYGKPVEPVPEFEMIERVSMKKHAERLIKKGLVVFEEGKYRRL